MTDLDVMGDPIDVDPVVSREWAVRVDPPGGPGPMHLPCRADEELARLRLRSWQTDRPEARPVLLSREVVTTRGPWTETQ